MEVAALASLECRIENREWRLQRQLPSADSIELKVTRECAIWFARDSQGLQMQPHPTAPFNLGRMSQGEKSQPAILSQAQAGQRTTMISGSSRPLIPSTGFSVVAVQTTHVMQLFAIKSARKLTSRESARFPAQTTDRLFVCCLCRKSLDLAEKSTLRAGCLR